MGLSTGTGPADDDRCRHGHPFLLDARLWGKEKGLTRPYPVVCHLVDTGAYFAELWESVIGRGMRARIAGALGLGEDEAGRELSFWAALHDLGKISPSFQHMLSRSLQRERPDHFAELLADGRYRHRAAGTDNCAGPHDRITHWSLPGVLEQLGYPAGGRLPHTIGQLLGGHHGRFHRRPTRVELKHLASHLPQSGSGAWPEQRLHHARLLRTLLTGDGPVPDGSLPAELSVVVLGAVMVADWLASDTPSIEAVRRREDEECCCAVALTRHRDRAWAAARNGLRQRGLERCAFVPRSREEVLGAAEFPAGSVHGRIAERLLSGTARPGMLMVSAPPGPDRRRLGLVAASVLGRASGARGVTLALPEELHREEATADLKALAGRLLEGPGLLTRVHPVFFDSDAESASEQVPQLSLGEEDLSTARKWLTERRRSLLAALDVCTHDQVLSAVLPVDDNAVRLFALSEKVLVVDDVRPQEPWLHQLLCLLVEWLAALGAPVVLLTDTVAGATADRLVHACLSGARAARGERSREEDAPPPADLPQPGWVHVDPVNGSVTRRAVSPGGATALRVTVTGPHAGSRAEGYMDAVAQQAGTGGSTLVCCESVEEAQETFRAFEEHRGQHAAPGKVRLLHSRFPWYRVHELAAECRAVHRDPVRNGSVLVTTPSFAEHLPFRFERVVTPAAPLPSLLARGARGRTLTVLDGEGDGTPAERALHRRTVRALHAHGSSLRLPRDTAELVRCVYDAESYLSALGDVAALEQRRLDSAAAGREAHLHYDARFTGIPGPLDVNEDLYELSRAEYGLTREHLDTRMGFGRAYVLCVHLRGKHAYFDPAGEKPVPKVDEPSRAVAEIAQHVIPVPPDWAPAGGISAQIGQGRFNNIGYGHWKKRAWLNRVYPVVLSTSDGPCTGTLGSMRLELGNTGLIRTG